MALRPPRPLGKVRKKRRRRKRSQRAGGVARRSMEKGRGRGKDWV